ncbi:MAG: helix-turn-helix domain-containing protein [Phascolarctobacterium sp.]|uniref:helix-turn-helix domain-containing protein n=1 Tax=Phascolarctobacterium sp. TaxID=2049039 RepID=UPI0026DCFFA7|nr:helix-turn-helix domain-containing protein [Phascolarctobacterium sp.]MDO4921686.1 helix-turn-helix domain-containing protein [Phascolarctobacterium sp.]
MDYSKDVLLATLRKEIGEALADCRKKRGLKQKELATMCVMSERLLIGIENGYINYSIDKYLLVSVALDVDIAELMGRARDNINAEAREQMRLTERLNRERADMQKRLEGYRKGKEREPAKERRAKGSQEAETKAKRRPKGLARGGRCAKIFMGMILDLLMLRKFVLYKV